MMELYDAEVAWFAAATELPVKTSLYDLKRTYYASETELPVSTPLYDLQRTYFAARTGLDVSVPLVELERAFLAQETELPLTSPLDDLRRAYYGPPGLPPIRLLDGGVDAFAESADGSWWTDPWAQTVHVVFGREEDPSAYSGDGLVDESGTSSYEFTGLETETAYEYSVLFTAEGYSDLTVAGSFVTTAF